MRRDRAGGAERDSSSHTSRSERTSDDDAREVLRDCGGGRRSPMLIDNSWSSVATPRSRPLVENRHAPIRDANYADYADALQTLPYVEPDDVAASAT